MRPGAGLAAVGVGAVLVLVGAAGLVIDDDEDGGGGGGVVASSTTTTSAPTTTSAVPAETPEELYALLEVAFQTGDGDALFTRLDAAVLDVYGEEQCRSYVDGLERPDLEFEVVEVYETAPWDFGKRDGLTVPIDDAIQVDIVQIVGGERAPVTEAHVRYEGDELRWFTDCGDPV